MNHYEPPRVVTVDPPQRVVELDGMSFVRFFLWIPPVFTAVYFLTGTDPKGDMLGEWGWLFVILGCVWILGAKAHRYSKIRPGIWGNVFKVIAVALVFHAAYRHTRDFFHPDPD